MVFVEVVEKRVFVFREVLVVEEAFLFVFCGIAIGGGVELAEFLGLCIIFLFFIVLIGEEGDSSFVVLALLLGLGLGHFAGLEELERLLQFALFALAERFGH